MLVRHLPLPLALLAAACGSTTEASSGGSGGHGGSSADQVQIEGTVCATPESSLVCGSTKDGAHTNVALYCKSGAYVNVGACPDGTQCVNTPEYASVRCGLDDSANLYSVAGAACPLEGVQVCSFDATAVHVCQGGHWIAGVHCPPSSCGTYSDPATGNWVVGCLNGGYSVGDVCQWSGSGEVCSTDGTKVLGCSGGKTYVVKDCAGKKCVVSGGVIACQ